MNSTWVQINSRLRDSTVIHKITSLSCFVDLPPISNTNCSLILAQELTFNCHRVGMTGPLLPPKSLPVCLVNQVELKSEEIKKQKKYDYIITYLHTCMFYFPICTSWPRLPFGKATNSDTCRDLKKKAPQWFFHKKEDFEKLHLSSQFKRRDGHFPAAKSGFCGLFSFNCDYIWSFKCGNFPHLSCIFGIHNFFN